MRVLMLVWLMVSPLSLCGQSLGQSLASGSANYMINYQGQSAGAASYTVEAVPGGYSIAAQGSAKIGNIELAFSKNETLDGNAEIVSESLNGTINGQAVFVTVRPEGAKFRIDTSASGQHLSNTLDRQPHTIFMPNFDPSAIRLFLRHASASRDLWALIPQQSGLLAGAKVDPRKDEKGTLNGSPIAVRHSTLVVANVTSELFSSVDGLLLQQEVPTQGFSMVHDGFILTPPKASSPQPSPSPSTPSNNRVDAPPAPIH